MSMVTLMPYGKVQRLLSKMRRNRGPSSEFYVINITLVTEQLAKLHTGEELTAKQRTEF
jgi:hypothetical protein